MKRIQKIIELFPVPIQNWAISLFGYFWNRRRFGGIYQDALANFKEREFYSKDQWLHYQTTELRKLLLHSFKHVPYYRDLLKSNGWDEQKLLNFQLSNLHEIPPLEKDVLRKLGTTTLLKEGKKDKGRFYASSGSTGTPVQIYFSRKAHQKWSAVFETRIRNWAGVSIHHCRGMIGGRRIISRANAKPPYYRYNRVERQVYFSAYHLSPANINGYLSAFDKYPIDYMTGYASANYALAKFIKSQNKKVNKLKAVITSSEKLTPEMRDLFREVYGCETFDSYSGVEACGLITQNEYGQLLISPDVGIMEILKEDGSPCLPGEEGEIYSTGFLNYDQPLIRYRIGDRVRLAKDQVNKCGRNMVVVEEIIGRTEDVVTGPDGREMVRFHGVYLGIPKIIEAQFIQITLDQIELKVAVDSPLSVTEIELMKSRVKSQLGNVSVAVNQVDSIPKNNNGKFKAVISHVLNSNEK